ncbi:hypothetical protein BofuT4_P005070.1 [Botrytis cinerea T4]|uniref:Uncharacterized protein n=1 Tax=Botryotinia fuckeliana (strain T4) TaxID=999810 RepID=G2Y3V8_BOTF4|nr:hypothetical protein BofuT4_P005070.1 [Botrytis cinerea T4]
MSSWNFTGVDFNNMLEEPSWAFSHLPLNNNSEFIPKTPEEGEEEFETIPLDDMYDADDEYPSEDDLDNLLLDLEKQQRLSQELYSRAKDSKQPNPPSNSSDYLQESSLQYPPRINVSSNIRQTTFVIANNREIERKGQENAPWISEVPLRKIRVQLPSLTLNLPSPINFGKAFSLDTSETMDKDFVPNMLEGFETMNIGELIQDYESGDILHPTEAQKFRCDIERPEVFSMEPHWFNDTKDKKCWCIHCIQYRKTQSTDQDEALAELQKQIQLHSPEQRIQDSEELVTETSQELPTDPLCEEFTTVVSELNGGPSELLSMVRENLWMNSDSDSDSDSDADSDADFDNE